MKKILHLLYTNSFSGAENVVITFMRSTKDKLDSYYVSLNGPIREYLNEEKLKYKLIQGKKITVRKLRKIIAEIKPDIIHAHDYRMGFMAVLTGTSIPIINHLHNNALWINRFNINSMLYYVFSKRYKIILTVSGSIMNEYIFGSKLANKTKVVGNPFDMSVIQELSKEECKENKYWDIAFLGRFSKAKNPIQFIEIIENINKRINIKAVMIGDGELKGEIEKLISEKGMEEIIELKGYQKNPYKYLKRAKILCMPSIWEGFGLASVEALALGKPVYASPVGGLVDIIDASCGKLCATTQEFAEKIIECLQNDSIYKRLSKGAEKKAESIDNIESYAEDIMNIYNNLIEEEVS
ncbi:MAG: glycosyltransferase [Ruminococcus flavefaciens]|nr:glycosyltransferase [Ruminococcus flavefaciens]